MKLKNHITVSLIFSAFLFAISKSWTIFTSSLISGVLIDIDHILDYSMGATVKSVQETGSAIILSALTSLAGYASLNVAHHKGVNSIATTVEIGITVCTICALFMLPALFELNFGKGNKAQFKNRTDTNASG